MSYAFIIDHDLLDEDEPVAARVFPEGRTIVRGSGEDAKALAAFLKRAHARKGASYTFINGKEFRSYKFTMYDDDNIPYFKGRLITDEGQSEDACYGPLSWGQRDSGCTRIHYDGHPEMDVS